MPKFSNRQRAYHQQVLKEVGTMLATTKSPVQKISNTKDHDWASQKISNLISNCKV